MNPSKTDSILRLALAALIGGVVGAAMVWMFQTQSFHLTPAGMSYPDLAATSLTAVSVLVTILGVFIAILAVWGYSQFQGIASSAAKTQVNEQLKDGDLRKHVESAVRQYMEAEFEAGSLRKLLEERVDLILFSGASEREREKKISGTEDDES